MRTYKDLDGNERYVVLTKPWDERGFGFYDITPSGYKINTDFNKTKNYNRLTLCEFLQTAPFEEICNADIITKDDFDLSIPGQIKNLKNVGYAKITNKEVSEILSDDLIMIKRITELTIQFRCIRPWVFKYPNQKIENFAIIELKRDIGDYTLYQADDTLNITMLTKDSKGVKICYKPEIVLNMWDKLTQDQRENAKIVDETFFRRMDRMYRKVSEELGESFFNNTTETYKGIQIVKNKNEEEMFRKINYITELDSIATIYRTTKMKDTIAILKKHLTNPEVSTDSYTIIAIEGLVDKIKVIKPVPLSLVPLSNEQGQISSLDKDTVREIYDSFPKGGKVIYHIMKVEDVEKYICKDLAECKELKGNSDIKPYFSKLQELGDNINKYSLKPQEF